MLPAPIVAPEALEMGLVDALAEPGHGVGGLRSPTPRAWPRDLGTSLRGDQVAVAIPAPSTRSSSSIAKPSASHSFSAAMTSPRGSPRFAQKRQPVFGDGTGRIDA